MAATLQQHCATNGSPATRTTNTATTPNPQLKRLVYSKYRELLGSYNDQANAYIDTLPSFMVQKDTGFNLELKNSDLIINSTQQNGNVTAHQQQHEVYGAGQRMPAQQTYEAPACVQNAMMTKDKKPFTYTPGGIDLSQIKSERMAKRLARNAQAEGATGIQQQNRPTQPQSPGGSSPSAAASMGAAAMGMPFQVLPPPPPPSPGKSFNGGSAPAPPPPPPSSSNFSNAGTLAPPANGNGIGGRVSAPNSPNMPRKSPTPQRFEPPPMGFRPEIKIPPNPMAALRKVPPPVEKNTFWKDEYVKDRSKSPMVDVPPQHASSNNDSVYSNSSSPQTTNANNNGTAILNNDNTDGFKKTMPTTTTNNSIQQQNPTNNNNYTNYQQQQQQQLCTPPTPPQQPQQSPIRPLQQSPQYGGPQPPTAQLQQTHISQQATQPQQPQQSYRPEFRSVAAPTSPAVNVYTRQSDSPRSAENTAAARATESPFKFSQQQQRAPPAVSPLAQQQSTPSTASSGASVSPNNPAQAVPWRTQRGHSQQPQQQAQPSVVAQSHPQPIYNNVQQPPQRTPDFSTQQSAYQGPKPTNVGSLYIAPLAPPTEPQAQHIVRQQMQQQQQHRDSPIRQTAPHQQQQQPNPQLRWMSSQPMNKEQPAWARPEENGNVVPSSLNRIKSPPPPTLSSSSSPSPATHPMYQPPLNQGNGFMPQTGSHNFGAQPVLNTTGLRLQINTPVNQANAQPNAPKERIIPIQLEQTPTYSPAQPSFNHGAGSNSPAPGYVMRTPNQFVDQGYNNFGQQQQQHQQQTQRVMSPSLQQLNAPRMVQQTQNNTVAGHKTHIIPIAIETNEGTRGPISKTPIVIQNDQRTPPVQSKSFRILQKITDTIDDGTNGDSAKQQQQQLQQQHQHVLQEPIEPQLQRPTFARQMSAQQARHSPTVEQMRRMQIGHEQGNYSAPTTPSAFIYNQQRSLYDNSPKYIPPSEQQVAEPKKYTGSAIPSRSFKILQAMTQPENAEFNEFNEIETKPESNNYNSCASSPSNAEPALSSSSTTINSELVISSSCSPTPTPPPLSQTQHITYPTYPYPYGYPWYLPPPPPHHMSATQNSENWHCPFGVPTPGPVNGNGEHPAHYPPYPYYYPYYPPPPPPSSSQPHSQTPTHTPTPNSEYDMQHMYPSYMPPPPPYLAYPYPVAPSYSQGSNSSRASSVLPDIIITPSTDDVPSKVIMQHHIKVEKDAAKKRASSIEIEDVTTFQPKSLVTEGGSVVDMLTQQLENMQQCLKNNLNTNYQAKKSFKKNIEQKSPEENTSPIQITMEMPEPEREMDQASSDSEITPKPVALKSIKSVNNVQIYKGKKLQQMEPQLSSDSEETKEADDDEGDDDDETTADGESDIFDEEYDEDEHDFELEQDSETEDFTIDDSLSVIYEESEMEKSCNVNKTVKQNENHNNEEVGGESTPVTVRLPLKFSFSSAENDEKIATLEVGKSQVAEQRSSSSVISEKRNNFNVASIKSSDTDDDDDDNDELEDCDVSVTISLGRSSRSSSLDNNQQVYKNIDHLYPIEDMPLPDEVFGKLEESSQDDVSVSFSLNMRNKFANETNKGGFTNDMAMMAAAENEKSHKREIENDKEVGEELDFFATLMATKMQAQKIKEQSASYWGKSQDKAEEATEIEETSPEKTKKKDGKLNGRKKTLKKAKSKAKIVTKTDDLKENEEITSKKVDLVEDTSIKDKCEARKFSFWDRCSSEGVENQVQEQPAKFKTNNNDQHQEYIKNSSINSANTHSNSQKMESGTDVQEAEEIVDIWADREEDFPPIKPIKSKLKSLETARQSFWSSVHESEKEVAKITEAHPHKPLTQAEIINKIDLNVHTLSYSINELAQPQQGSADFVAEEMATKDVEEPEEVDFWAEINKAKLGKSLESRQEVSVSSNLQDFSSSSGEHYYSDENIPMTTCALDPFKYPEEPREVDTDEEIDFWAEIEAKRQAAEDDVTFHKSVSFWASQERQNSADETPYKPVLPKPFHARLPDEPPSENINIWAALEAHKGEEPVIIDPIQEEEKLLAQQYDIMITKQELSDKRQFNNETVLAQAPIEVPLWCSPIQKEHELATEVTNIQETLQDIPKSAAPKTETDELEVKRSNYRKAMAFFTTSIDENRGQNIERCERGKSKYARNSSYIEEENEKWDWDAVNEALEQEKETSNTGISTENKLLETIAKEQIAQTVVAEYNNRLCESEYSGSLGNNNYSGHAVVTTKALIPEGKDLKEACKEPTPKCLSNGLPDLEVNKFNEDRKLSVKDRICAFETGSVEKSTKERFSNSMQKQCLSVESSTRQSSLSRNSSTQRSESEMDEDDSGVTDMNRRLSETDTESESFPELRKMSSYQRAATHSRLFKLLQEDPDLQESHNNADEYQFKPSRRKIVHNVSITRKQNPTALAEAETMSQRRERLSLPLCKNTSIDNDNPSTPNSPASPIMGHTANKSPVVSEKLVSELVQSLLLKSDSTHFRKLPMEKLQAAAKRVLEEELDSLENTSIESTPALTPSDMKKDKSYNDYYNTWSDALGAEDIVPSKSFRALQDSRRSPWTARCPRVLSSKTINRDLARVTESPEIFANNRQSRETSIGKWKKS